MKPRVTMREALTDPMLLGEALPGDSWMPWRTMLIAGMGEELTSDERTIFAALTGREREPLALIEEFYGICGRRSGKTRAAGSLAAYVGALCDHDDMLAPGERGTLPVLAASMSQAGRAFSHARGVLEQSPVLRDELDGEPTAGVIRLRTGVDIEVRPASFRTIRGATAVAAICDEVAFWLVEGTSNPDVEILNALRPALATTGGPLWIISSPYGRRGELYRAFRRHFGPNSDPSILVAKGASRLLNPTLPQRVVDRAYERDPVAAASEYGAEFRADLEAFVSRDVVEACVAIGVHERPPLEDTIYQGFVDPSGGSADSMTLAIGHMEGERVIIDAVRERRPPFSPASVVEEFAALLRAYWISTVTGDRWGGEFAREPFRKLGIQYDLAEKPRSDLYREMLPLLMSGRIELMDSSKLVDQIAGLERRVARGGRESIDHRPGGHDDVANAVAGVAYKLSSKIDLVETFIRAMA